MDEIYKDEQTERIIHVYKFAYTYPAKQPHKEPW